MSEQNVSPINNHKSTPPAFRKIRNPFDKVLIDKLHKPLCSPGMCKVYKTENNTPFRWEIDQACELIPADIVACNSQFEPSPDPAMEKIAEEATERFFSQDMVMPSPLESSKKIKSVLKTSGDISTQIGFQESTVMLRDISAQTVLTLPPQLPPEVEKALQPFFTFTQDQNVSRNDSLRYKLLFQEQNDVEHYDSEQTDDEIVVERRPSSRCEAHIPLTFSPDLSRNMITQGMKRTFDTPINKCQKNSKPYKNKILDVVDFEPCLSPIRVGTPQGIYQDSVMSASSSLASSSISPVAKSASGDEEKYNGTSSELESMAICLVCAQSESQSMVKESCNCKKTPKKSVLKRSTSLKESPPRSRKSSISFSHKRSLSTSSLQRNRSVQKLDFSMDMSVDGSLHNHSKDSETLPSDEKPAWYFDEETSIQHLVKVESLKANYYDIQSSTKGNTVVNVIDETPVKGKCKSIVRTHEISKIRTPFAASAVDMSLDNSLDGTENLLNMEHKKIDFNTVDLKFLTENVSNINYTANSAKVGRDNMTFKRIDSGYNDNTFYGNASSYYESAIKPSELTITNASKANISKTALKEISNVHWARVDSGFKDENSTDSTQFYHANESLVRKDYLPEEKLQDKENVVTDFGYLTHTYNKNEPMSMSDIFTDDMTFNCNFSSTPSKSKSRKYHS